MENSITLWQGDCLDLMPQIPDKSVDMIFTDLPYGTTNCRWDSPIPLQDYVIQDGKPMYKDEYLLHIIRKKGLSYGEAENSFRKEKKTGLWTQYNRIIKDHGAILLFAQTPYDKVLGASNLPMLRYEWVWEKTQATGHLNAKKMPMKAHENILVFYKKLPTYNPQMTEGHTPIHSYTKYISTQNNTKIYGKMAREISGGGETTRYPRSVLTFASDKQTCYLHPTQKPLALCEYMIKTYTSPGDTILDSCMGSGTCGVACRKLGRRFIGIEKDAEIFRDAEKRIWRESV